MARLPVTWRDRCSSPTSDHARITAVDSVLDGLRELLEPRSLVLAAELRDECMLAARPERGGCRCQDRPTSPAPWESVSEKVSSGLSVPEDRAGRG